MKVSVIIYVLNSISYIERCVRSVMNQTMREIEILIIDGGSTDGTWKIIESLSREDTRIRLIHSAPGVGLQFNTGLKEAKGEYIGICESDDYILPEMYEKQYELAKVHQLDILRADANHFVENGKGEEIVFPVRLSRREELYDCVLNLTEDKRVLELGVNGFWSGLYRREFLLDEKLLMNETKGAAYQDTAFSFLTAIKAKRAMLSRKAFYCYRLDNPNSSVNNPQKITLLMEEYYLLKKRLKAEELFEKYQEEYFFWKVRGHLGFYDSLSENLRKEYVPFMYKDIERDMLPSYNCEYRFSEREKEVVSRIRQSETAVGGYLAQTYQELENMRRTLEQIGQMEQVLVFGCGDLGRLVHRYMIVTGRELKAYADNNNTLWGTLIGDIPVLEPKRAVQLFPDAVYIIANVEHFREIKGQLEGYQVSREKIILCKDYGFFFKYILLKAIKDLVA